MKKWHLIGRAIEPDPAFSEGVQDFYLASDVDARIAELEQLVFEAFDTMASAEARHDNKAGKAKGHQPHIFHKQRADQLGYWLDRAGPIYNELKKRSE